MLYSTLGQTIERDPWTPLTDRCWNFDTEAIEDHGAYVAIMQNLERISRGEFKLENLNDYVDIEEEQVQVSFTFQGQEYEWELAVDNDWVDASLFAKVVELTKQLQTAARFTYFDIGGQDCVIGFETPEGLQRLVEATGLKIVWLS